MLILTRKPGQTITIGEHIRITIMEIKSGQVKLGVQAPKDVAVFREEVYARVKQENIMAARAGIPDLERIREAWARRNREKGEDED